MHFVTDVSTSHELDVVYRCPECGGQDISCLASACYDAMHDKWSLAGNPTGDCYASCNDCQNEGSLVSFESMEPLPESARNGIALDATN